MKQVKVDNWGIYFLQRLKHFFNRTDYCDLTLQFQDNAQLKVHRLVLNACTEYFELLERTCEMYEDCLIMPDDLQAEVVVPIVNFMYTGQLEFEMDLLEKLFQTSQIMNIQVLSKLLDAQRHQGKSRQVNPTYLPPKQNYYGRNSKRPHPRALESMPQPPEKKAHISTSLPSKKPAQQPIRKPEKPKPVTHSNTVLVQRPQKKVIKPDLVDPRPTRYEVPEELDTDNIYDNSFMSISYDSKPLMIHPETTKRPQTKKPGFALFSEASSSKKSLSQNTSLEVECRKISTSDGIFDDDISNDSHYYNKAREVHVKPDPGLLFDQVIESNPGPKMVIETKDTKQASNIDHAKIISEVLKKYPHLVNSNKNIKLKILDPQTKPVKKPQKKKDQQHSWSQRELLEPMRVKEEELDNTYEDVHNSKEAARLISLGAENINGPWICLICGTPGKALHFPTYYKFRRHLVEVHNEKPIPNICEYCGLKSGKRNYLLHHMYTKHDVPPPPNYHFPKCNQCSYIALTEGFLVKHKASHTEQRDFRCNVCFSSFKTSVLLLRHIQATGHKFTAERKANLQCIYCQRVFLREGNLYAHLKTSHKMMAKRDGIVEDSDEEESTNVKYELPVYEPEDDDNVNEMQYQIQSSPDGNIQVTRSPAQPRQKILNTGLKQSKPQSLPRTTEQDTTLEDEISSKTMNLNEEMMISEQEYLNVNQIEQDSDQYYMPSMEQAEPELSFSSIPKTAVSYMNSSNKQQVARHSKPPKKPANTNEVIEIVMPNVNEIEAADPPVIFDADGNPGKTLAVLTTLDNPNNDMMILPDDGYSINVTQGDDISNQNIVVVYSHTGDTSKPYIMEPQYAQSQIITTQGAQFAQAPAIITPNYIVTTSAEIIAQASPQVYQENEQSTEVGQETLEEQNVLQTEIHEEQAIVTSVNDPANQDNQVADTETEQVEETDISNVAVEGTELQEQRVALVESPTYTQQEMEMGDEESAILSHDVSQQIEFSEQQTSRLEIANDKEGEIENFIETQPEVTSEVEYMVDETELQSEQDIPFDITDNNKVTEPNIEESSDAMEIAEETLENEPTVSVQEEGTVVEAVTEVVQPATTELPIPSTQQIRSLASEWSEDEEDIPAVEKDPETEVNPEMEESIENIEQEMQKAVSGVDTEDETEPEMQEHLQGDHEQPSTTDELSPNGAVEAPQKKLSSLLNDWDDNDSQEENDATNNANQEPSQGKLPEQKTNNTEENSVAVDAEDPNKTPLKVVKSLVSDWDDEEDESKE